MSRDRAPGADREAGQEEDLLRQPHRPEEHGPAQAHDPESRGGGGGRPDAGRLPSGEEMVPRT